MIRLFRITPTAIEKIDTIETCTFYNLEGYISDHYLFDSDPSERYLAVWPDGGFATFRVEVEKKLVSTPVTRSVCRTRPGRKAPK